MKAVIHDEFGGPEVLELRDIDPPSVGADDVRVRVRVAALNPLDLHFLTGIPYLVRGQVGFRRPRQPVRGMDLAGEVDAVGVNVAGFRPGDAVFGLGPGALAELTCLPEDRLAPKPRELTFEAAAAAPLAGLTALQALRDKAGLRSGHKVLVNGASGGVGTFTVQVAKALGAEVVGVCSTRNVELVESLGADRVVDYTREDFTETVRDCHAMIDMIGNHSWAECRRVLAPEGRLVPVGGPKTGRVLGQVGYVTRRVLASLFDRRKVVPILVEPRTEDLVQLAEMLDEGTVEPVVDRTYPLAEAAEAFRHLAGGHARGKVVVEVRSGGGADEVT